MHFTLLKRVCEWIYSAIRSILSLDVYAHSMVSPVCQDCDKGGGLLTLLSRRNLHHQTVRDECHLEDTVHRDDREAVKYTVAGNMTTVSCAVNRRLGYRFEVHVPHFTAVSSTY